MLFGLINKNMGEELTSSPMHYIKEIPKKLHCEQLID
jgi:hypothetical protein